MIADLRSEAPGIEIEAEQPLSQLISHMLSGVNAQVATHRLLTGTGLLSRPSHRARALLTYWRMKLMSMPRTTSANWHYRVGKDDRSMRGRSSGCSEQLIRADGIDL